MIKIGKRIKIAGTHLITQPMCPNIDYLEIASAYKEASELVTLQNLQDYGPRFLTIFYPVRISSQLMMAANRNVSHVTELTDDVVQVVNFIVLNPIETTEIRISVLSDYYKSVEPIYDQSKVNIHSYSNQPDPFWVYDRTYEPPYRFTHIPVWIKQLQSLIQQGSPNNEEKTHKD